MTTAGTSTTEYFSQALGFVKERPILSTAAAATTLAVAAGGYAYRYYNSTDYKIRQLFKKLLISDWDLPGLSQNKSQSIKINPVLSIPKQTEIDAIREMIVKSRDNGARSPIPNLIFTGKPGVGKTMLLENICRDSGIGFVRIPSGAMENHLKTATHITALHGIFNVIEKSKTPVYIIIDDGEELVARRTEKAKAKDIDNIKADWIVEKEQTSEILAQRRTALVNAILEESGKDVRKVGFAITTNRPEVIDGAFKTRAREILIDPPGTQERIGIIKAHLPRIFDNNRDVLDFFRKGVLADMGRKTEGFTGRNIVRMLEALHACVQLEEGEITQELIDTAIAGQAKTIKVDKKTAILQAQAIAEAEPAMKAQPAGKAPVQVTPSAGVAKILTEIWNKVSSSISCLNT